MIESPASRAAGRRKVLLVASLFFVPLLAAIALYFTSAWRPSRGVEHGELIDPPRPLANFALTWPDGNTAPIGVMRGYWSLVVLVDDRCGGRCAATLEELVRVRAALDKDAVRVRRVLLHDGRCCGPQGPPARGSDLLMLGAGGEPGAAWRAQFPRGAGGEAGVYLVDPQGNLMMRYPDAADATGILRDLERLLRLSRIG